MHISDGGIQLGSIFIEGYSPEKFPKIAPPEGRITRSLNIPEITEKLQFAGKALSQKVYNTALRGIYIDLNGNCLAGSDGNRLHVVSIQEQGRNLNGSNNADNGIILPASVLKAAKLHTGAVNIITSKNPKHAQQAAQFPLTVPGCVDCSSVYRAINGNYPQYHEAIPKGFSSTFRVNKQELAQVLHRGLISYATDADSKPIIAHFKSGMLTVEVRTHGRIAFRGKVSGNYSGRPYHGSVDCRYLLDALTTMPGESVDILLQGNPNEAWTLKDDRGYMAVIMPIVSASSVK
ncbi:MAG: hypothetical protein MRJ65_15425 [Candidatus Brocadiaceae bacterium]|nr:hypothetical protein [Candidatus Brocadiaceae bacterium]